jgi:hypothetical protein
MCQGGVRETCFALVGACFDTSCPTADAHRIIRFITAQ